MQENRRTIDALEVAWIEEGPAEGKHVLLLHGFPDDATSYADVMGELARRGRRALAPFIRGFGGTVFRDDATPRSGDFAALGHDALAFVDALDLRDLTVVGQDWGSPTAEIVAALRPERVSRLVKLNWYGVYGMAEMASAQAFDYSQLGALWYVWLLNTPLGEMALTYDRDGFCRSLWDAWSPTWEAGARHRAFASVQASFKNPDFVRVVLSAYRSGVTPHESDPRHAAVAEALKALPPVQCPAVILNGQEDGVEKTPLSAAGLQKHFPRLESSRRLPGVGHFAQREAPHEVVAAILGR